MRVEDWSGLGKKTIEHVEDISIKNENKHIIGPKKHTKKQKNPQWTGHWNI